MLTGKSIALFSDRTGNSSAKLFKTNVWRMYQALDVGDRQAEGLCRQIAYYDDGVGTSPFRPLAILGGVLGLGLKRNVLDLYKFLCRNHEPGDRIYAFGFSRGAFTIRLLVGLVAHQGLLRGLSEEELDRQAPQAYRVYRRQCFKAWGLAAVVRDLWDRITGSAHRPLQPTQSSRLNSSACGTP